jgi:hypothetical protein
VSDQPDCFLENLDEKVEVQIRDWSFDESLEIAVGVHGQDPISMIGDVSIEN